MAGSFVTGGPAGCSYLDADGTLALRLPAGDRERFVERYGTRLHEAYGIVQKEYVTVPAALLDA